MSKDLRYYLSLSYPYELSREPGEQGYFATHPDLPGCMAEGGSADDAVSNLDVARELWIEARLEGGYDVPEPVGDDYSGRVSLRMTTSLHARLAELARRQGMSLNSLINSALAELCGAASANSGISATLSKVLEKQDRILDQQRELTAVTTSLLGSHAIAAGR